MSRLEHRREARDSLKAALSLDMKEDTGDPALLSASAELNANEHSLTLVALKGTWRGGTLALDGPASIAYGGDLSVQHLTAHLGGGTVIVSGSLSPKLALQAKLQGVKLEDFPRLMPTVAPRGTLSADIALSGTLAAPIGHIAFKGEGLSAAATGNGTPPAVVTADIALAGGNADVAAAIRAGTAADLALKGRVPLAADQAMALHAQGKLDLALFDPLVAPGGQRARGLGQHPLGALGSGGGEVRRCGHLRESDHSVLRPSSSERTVNHCDGPPA